MAFNCPACPPERCNRRVVLASGAWTCRYLAEAGALPLVAQPDPSGPRVRTAGWSHRAVIACPICGNRPYSEGPGGAPERRCDGPAGCGFVWNPEASVRPPLASLVRAGRR